VHIARKSAESMMNSWDDFAVNVDAVNPGAILADVGNSGIRNWNLTVIATE